MRVRTLQFARLVDCLSRLCGICFASEEVDVDASIHAMVRVEGIAVVARVMVG